MRRWSQRSPERLSRLVFALALLAHAATAAPAALTGTVIGVSDGDTLTVLVDRRRLKVRLAEIDAPEKKQAFGTRSRLSLSEICFGKSAELDSRARDRYGRLVAGVTCTGVDANAEQVARGMAWVFDRYAKPDSPLYSAQDEARAARRGLWADSAPVPPWEWRRDQAPR